MKQTMRSFAFGLLTAGVILLGVFYFAGNYQTDAGDIPADDMIDHLEQKGYHVLTESEYITVSVESDNDDKQDSQDKSDEDSDKENDDKPETYTLEIKSGTVPSEISEKLEKHDVIDDAGDFTDFMEENDFSDMVQLGEFELSSDMDHKEIAETLTE